MTVETKEMILKFFAENDYPIVYKGGLHGRGMGYGDFEKLMNKLTKNSKQKETLEEK